MDEDTTKEVLRELRSIARHAYDSSNYGATQKELLDDLDTVAADLERLIDMIEYQKMTQNLWKDGQNA